ncbi:hypothetical protein QBC37DRAFT_407997, partial [Rhypophila decipiens]
MTSSGAGSTTGSSIAGAETSSTIGSGSANKGSDGSSATTGSSETGAETSSTIGSGAGSAMTGSDGSPTGVSTPLETASKSSTILEPFFFFLSFLDFLVPIAGADSREPSASAWTSVWGLSSAGEAAISSTTVTGSTGSAAGTGSSATMDSGSDTTTAVPASSTKGVGVETPLSATDSDSSIPLEPFFFFLSFLDFLVGVAIDSTVSSTGAGTAAPTGSGSGTEVAGASSTTGSGSTSAMTSSERTAGAVTGASSTTGVVTPLETSSELSTTLEPFFFFLSFLDFLVGVAATSSSGSASAAVSDGLSSTGEVTISWATTGRAVSCTSVGASGSVIIGSRTSAAGAGAENISTASSTIGVATPLEEPNSESSTALEALFFFLSFLDFFVGVAAISSS